jgi:hypothetical protein
VTARILVFGYDASHVRSPDDLLSIDFLVSCERELLHWYPFAPAPDQSNPSADGQDAIKLNAAEQAPPTEHNAEQPIRERQLTAHSSSPTQPAYGLCLSRLRRSGLPTGNSNLFSWSKQKI